ncbi:MAG: glycoside hydrolase family 127 protein [Puniceicoccales bacterium]|nr:glycoside hydrolase family 127 protein [Puniceicoccales bacterium]
MNGYLDRLVKLSCEQWNKGDVPYKETAAFFRTGRRQFALGEMWGKLVRSGSLFYRYTADPELKVILEAAVADILSTERSNGSISCVPPNKQPETSDLWERKYVLIGLQDYYEYVEQKPEILESLKRQTDCLISQLGKPPKTSILAIGWSHGGHGKNHIESSTLLEPVVRLYKMTGEKRYLDFADYIISEGGCLEANLFKAAYDNILPYKMCKIYPKAYDTLSLFEGLVEFYRCTQNEYHKQCALNLFENVRKYEITIIGNGGSDHPYHPTVAGEAFGNTAIEQTNPRIKRMMETCTGVTWMKFCSHLLRLNGTPQCADEIEKYVYNGLIGAMKHDGRGFSYVNLLNGKKTNDHGWGWNFKDKRGGRLHVTCCNLNGPEGLAYVPYIAVMQDAQQNPIINFYESGTVKTKTPRGGALTVEIFSDFPKSGNVEIKVNVEKPESFTIKVRIPEWSEKTKLTSEGALIALPKTGQYAEVKRTWKAGDTIKLELDMRCKLIDAPKGGTSPNSDKYKALRYGPLVLCRDSTVDPNYSKPVKVIAGKDAFVDVKLVPLSGGALAFDVPTSDGVIRMFPYAQVNGWNGAKIQTWLPELGTKTGSKPKRK